ncbi:hypothetical protein BDFG_01186 [Blastomyces dermatitidis ATCC 26199]|nr:hypothetical protein BDFG_01186 [Blastomyces dermatitidis ATCC 26199]
MALVVQPEECALKQSSSGTPIVQGLRLLVVHICCQAALNYQARIMLILSRSHPIDLIIAFKVKISLRQKDPKVREAFRGLGLDDYGESEQTPWAPAATPQYPMGDDDSTDFGDFVSNEGQETDLEEVAAPWYKYDVKDMPHVYCPICLGEVLNGRYLIEHKLGAVGFSTVWMAHDLQENLSSCDISYYFCASWKQ